VTDVTTAVGRDGVASIAWSSARAGNPIEVVSVDRTGRFGAPQRLASTARYITGIVGQDDGGSLLQWEETGALREASREPGSTAFGAASPADTRADLLEGAVLIDARTGS
jgi:hypothetical protein